MSEDLQGMNLVELFDELVQPDAPEPISMWPQTVGWLWLLFFVVALVVFIVWRWLRWRKATAYRRVALKELQLVGNDPVAISNILRRTALAGFARQRVAGLYGEEWLAFLDKTAKGASFANSQTGQTLARAPYVYQEPDPQLSNMAANWIKTHRQGEHG